MERMERWQYYTSSFVRIEPTEGVDRRFMRKSVLTRNVPGSDADSDDLVVKRKALVSNEDLTLRICVNTAKIVYKEPGSEYFIWTDKPMISGDVPMVADDSTEKPVSAARERLRKHEEARTEKFKEKFEMNNPWMKGLEQAQVEKVKTDFKEFVDGTRFNKPQEVAEVEMAQ